MELIVQNFVCSTSLPPARVLPASYADAVEIKWYSSCGASMPQWHYICDRVELLIGTHKLEYNLKCLGRN